jgi:hypothetical protein
MKKHRNILKTLVAASALLAGAASAAEVTPSVPKANPESIAAGPDGTLYLGSQASAVIYRARPGETTATPFIDMKGPPGAFLLGVMADGATNTLWACEIMSMDRSSPLLKAVSRIRSFDLASGAPKQTIALPTPTNICNDFAVGPDKAVYLADTSNAQILRLRPGSSTLETVIQNPSLYGVDGITFLDGQLYVNTVWSNALFRIPLDAGGKAGTPVQIQVPVVLKSPDGMRAAGGKLYVAENSGGQVDELTITGDRASVRVVKTRCGSATGARPRRSRCPCRNRFHPLRPPRGRFAQEGSDGPVRVRPRDQ